MNKTELPATKRVHHSALQAMKHKSCIVFHGSNLNYTENCDVFDLSYFERRSFNNNNNNNNSNNNNNNNNNNIF